MANPTNHLNKLGAWWDKQSLFVQLAVGLLGAVVVWLLWGFLLIRVVAYLLHGKFADIEPQILGQLGDLFGGVNALFAAFAFVGVAIAAYYQHKTFLLQFEQSARQSFEPLFFKLLDSHRPPTLLLVDIDFWNNDDDLVWVAYSFDQCMNTLREALRSALDHTSKTKTWNETRLSHEEQGRRNISNTRVQARRIFESFYAKNDGELAPYFRKLYQVFKLIAASHLTAQDKVRYANIARASLNKDELLLIALNCATPRGEEFKPLVEGFGLLKHIPVGYRDSETVETVLAEHLYQPTATMSSEQREIWWRRFPEQRPTWWSSPKALETSTSTSIL